MRAMTTMEPIQNLLNGIPWNPPFGLARFAIGSYDRAIPSMVKIPFESIAFELGEHFRFQTPGDGGTARHIPYQSRVRGLPEWRTHLAASRGRERSQVPIPRFFVVT